MYYIQQYHSLSIMPCSIPYWPESTCLTMPAVGAPQIGGSLWRNTQFLFRRPGSRNPTDTNIIAVRILLSHDTKPGSRVTRATTLAGLRNRCQCFILPTNVGLHFRLVSRAAEGSGLRAVPAKSGSAAGVERGSFRQISDQISTLPMNGEPRTGRVLVIRPLLIAIHSINTTRPQGWILRS